MGERGIVIETLKYYGSHLRYFDKISLIFYDLLQKFGFSGVNYSLAKTAICFFFERQ